MTSKDKEPKPELLFIIFSVIMSISWIYIQANLIMDILIFAQNISGLDRVFLSMGLLSLGNSLGDLFVDQALAKRGLGIMAITGIFSGQLLNLLIGFALNCLFSSLK